jgi:peptidyl-tRNA hydrolase
MMAQVAHVASKLKMLWAAKPVMFSAKTTDKNTLSEVYKWVEAFAEQSVTTIVKLARDCDELEHIMKLANEAELWHVAFLDDNPEVYGKDFGALTALAIGPTTKEAVTGICDYLPLFR